MLEQAGQLLAVGISNGAFYAVVGASFALIITVTGRFHFALAATFAVSAFVAAILTGDGYNFWLALLAGGIVGAILGMLIEWGLYSRLVSVGGGGGFALLTIVVVALGLVTLISNLILLYWMPQELPRTINDFSTSSWGIGNIRFTAVDIALIVSGVVLIFGLDGLLRFGKLGRNIRATSVNPGLAEVVGINSRIIYVVVFGIGSFMAGIAAVFYGVQTAVTQDMGLVPIPYALLVAFLAGNGTRPVRVAAVGLGVGIFEAETNLWISAQYTQLVIYLVLFLYASSRSFFIKGGASIVQRG
jgi:branched-chain amino acid transport system permease protein